MTDRPPRDSDPSDDADGGRFPRWVKLLALVVAIVVLLVVVVMFMSGGHTTPPGAH